MSSTSGGNYVGDNSKYSGGVQQTPAKAINGASVAGAVTAIIAWIVSYFTGGNDADLNTLWAAIGSGVVSWVLTYGTVFMTKNKAKFDRAAGIS